MKKQRKTVSGRNYQTAGKPQTMPQAGHPAKDRPVLTEVIKGHADDQHDRVTAEVVPSRQEQANPGRRKLHPAWIIIPLVVIAMLMLMIWSGAYLAEGVRG